MAKVSEHLKTAEEFYSIGVEEYGEGRRLNDLRRIREGCKKVFHAYVEAAVTLIQKRGLLEPESHVDRWDGLSKLGEEELDRIEVEAYLWLQRHCYYEAGTEKKRREPPIKHVKEALEYVSREVGR